MLKAVLRSEEDEEEFGFICFKAVEICEAEDKLWSIKDTDQDLRSYLDQCANLIMRQQCLRNKQILI